ncbi:MAG: multidrug ABC transporter substrate-binding protein [Acidobacteria bacterium RIFCSPLOWO2_12_FULL_67_14b]|nr:MAG: multidrug ABC transporter substrate-binding protein [Acidobacteria bacterium RIFCSPLOWO2_12_FULL_67_14b]
MTSLVRKFKWWLQQRRKEAELREELEFHLALEAEERRVAGMTEDEARLAARRDLGNEARLREDVRTLWTWRPIEELTQDLRYAFRTLFKNRAVTAFAVLSLALGIGANTAIYSFMDAILLRSLPVADPASLVVMHWRATPFNFGWRAVNGSEFVLHSISGSFDAKGANGRIFPYAAFERLQEASAPVLSSLFAYFPAGRVNVMINGEAELVDAEYVSGDFFRGLAVSPAAGRLIGVDDDRAGAPPVAVVSEGYSRRRFGAAVNAVGTPILIDNVPFTVVGVAPAEFFGVDPAAAPGVYLPMHASVVLDPEAADRYLDQNYYWTGIMGRLRPGVAMTQAESAMAGPFAHWVATTATNDRERANLPVLGIGAGGGGLDTLRRRYSKPLYVLLAMVGLILAIACANTANLLLARAAARRREIAVRLSIGAGRFRLIRQLLTESTVLASLGGALGILIAIAGTRLLTVLLANGDAGFTLHAELNWHVLTVTLGLSLLCGVLFGLAPAIQSTRPALAPALKEMGDGQPRPRQRGWILRLRLQQALVVGQISLLMLLLVGAGLFVQTLSNLQSIPLGFNPENVLLFELNAPQAGYPASTATAFYADLRDRFSGIPGVGAATLSHSSLVRAGRGHPVTVDGVPAEGTRFLQTGPGFFSTMQIPILQGREIDERDREATRPVTVISDLFARTFFPNQNPLGRHIKVGGSAGPLELEVIGVAATARYGPLKYAIPPVIYVPYGQIKAGQLRQMTYALRTDGDPLSHVNTIRQIVHEADARVPVTNVVTQAAEIDRTINQEIVLARLGASFAVVALVIAGVGLYGTMAYAVVRRTREIGIRMALGARRGAVMWMVLRDVCIPTASGLLISMPIARGMSRFIESFLFEMKPNDPRALGVAVVTLVGAALVASYGPARRASRIDPMTALRHE